MDLQLDSYVDGCYPLKKRVNTRKKQDAEVFGLSWFWADEQEHQTKQ